MMQGGRQLWRVSYCRSLHREKCNISDVTLFECNVTLLGARSKTRADAEFIVRQRVHVKCARGPSCA